MNFQAILFLLFFLAFPMEVVFAQQSPIRAILKLKQGVATSNDANAKVIWIEGSKVLETDGKGNYFVTVPAPGFYSFRILAGGGSEIHKKEIYYDQQKIPLYAKESTNEGLFVVAEKDKAKISRYSLDNEEIKRLPGTQGDALKALKTLPGVVPAVPVGLTPAPQFNINATGQPYRNSDRGDFTFRGAGPRAN